MPRSLLPESQSKNAVISLGGSLIVPNEIDVQYLEKFKKFVQAHIELGWKFYIITGGGAPARRYIDTARQILKNTISKDDMDWLGIHATRLNAHLVRTIFHEVAQPQIVTDPEKDPIGKSKVVVIAGWKPGWSTDFVAVKIAQRVGSKYVMNLSNISQVYTDDPRKNPQAKPVYRMSWRDYRSMVGDEWTPGLNTPFDPIAAKLAEKINLEVLVMDGTNLENLSRVMKTGEFVGTVLSNRTGQ